MTPRERQVLAIIRDEPLVSQADIATRLAISRSAVAGHIMQLTAKGAIRGRGYLLADAPAVVCVGGANVDIQGKSTQPLHDGESNPGSVSVSAGGVARNVAEHLVRQGLSCRLISAIGADANGTFLRDHLRTVGLDPDDLQIIPGAATPTYLSLLDSNGELVVAVNDMQTLDALDAGLLARKRALLEEARVLVADTNLTVEALSFLGELARNRPLFIDTVSAAKAGRITQLLSRVHTLKMTRTEATAISGLTISKRSQLGKLANWFRDQGVERVFVTLGKEGVFFSDDDGDGLVGAPANGSVTAVTGAGDAFLAGLVSGWLDGISTAESITLGQSLATDSLKYRSAVPPTVSANLVEASQ